MEDSALNFLLSGSYPLMKNIAMTGPVPLPQERYVVDKLLGVRPDLNARYCLICQEHVELRWHGDVPQVVRGSLILQLPVRLHNLSCGQHRFPLHEAPGT